MTQDVPDTIAESPRRTPVIAQADVCVLGGSCTGVFDAVRAARLGMRVVLVERAGALGGVATLSLVNVWHSPLDTAYERRIIGGMTEELMDRLRRRGAVTDRARSPHWSWAFNPAELMIELDEVVREAGVRSMLHSVFVAPHLEDGRLAGAIIESKSGRGAVRARFFIDATGDGDLAHRLGLDTHASGTLQPSTTCALIWGWDRLKGVDPARTLIEHGPEHDLPEGFAWGAPVPGTEAYMLAGTRVYRADCSTADGLTHAEIEGRRQLRAILDILNRQAPDARLGLLTLPARIGIRETRHVRCRHHLTGQEVLQGARFPDAIANGSYRVDIHHHDRPGITFRYLDGTQTYVRPGHPVVESRWRDPLPAGTPDPTFYQIPYRSLLPAPRSDGACFDNLLLAGRMIDTDPEAHAAVRVMVNMNQTGEAAGVAAALCLQHQTPAPRLDARLLRDTLAKGGSVVV